MLLDLLVMRASQPIRLIAALVAILVMGVFVIVVLSASNLVVNLFSQLRETSEWLAIAYFGVLVLFAVTGAVIIWRLLSFTARPPREPPTPPNEDKLRADIARHDEAGIDVSSAKVELATLDQRRSSGEIYVSLYGQISHGKSSLIRALIPDAKSDVDVRGGTTRGATHYTWQSPVGDQLVIADVPGINESGQALDEVARAEALRAHIVVFVCDGDLTRDQWRALDELHDFNKPMVIAINKKDQYRSDELANVQARIGERLRADTPVVTIQTGGREEIVRVLPDGHEERVERERKIDIDALLIALQDTLLEHGELLTQLRDNAVFLLAAGKLDAALDEYRQKAAQELVDRYTRRAVIGGLAAFAPGADLVIQGSLAASLTRALCGLYAVSVRQVDLDTLIKGMSGKVGKPTPLLLAVAGNALKAFPGTGTVVGGLAHAVAYGLLFQSLGQALADTLSRHGELKPKLAVQAFEEKLSEDLATRAQDLVAIALSQKGKSTEEDNR